jgi:Uri superfamily endonuclease
LATRFAATEPDGSPARTYQLLIEVTRPVRVVVGRLGEFEFPAGLYCYTGSALRNIEARIRRHLSSAKKLHWHIDYLLAVPGVRIREVKRFAEDECRINRRAVGEIPAPGFGASDCRAGCGSHLKRVSQNVDVPPQTPAAKRRIP